MTKKYFGVLTAALMPDEPDADMRSVRPGAGSLYVRATQPAGDCYQPALGAPEQASKYSSLENVLRRALEQASAGKGSERHATGQAFEDQPMQTISRLVGSHHGLLYQAIKKAQESTRLPTVERQVAELLGAINYLAGAVLYLESSK